MTHKFKTGDKVVCIDGRLWSEVREGETYIVEKVDRDGKLKFEGFEYPGYDPEDFQLVTTEAAQVLNTENLIPDLNNILTLKFKGVSITLDTNVEFSRKFAEKFLDIAYGGEH